MRVKGKLALVTGGGSGIGAATCVRLAQEGASVVVADINAASARSVSEAIGGEAWSAQQDVTDEDRWRELIDEIIEKHGRLDILVNNAGIAIIGNVEDCSLAEWRKTHSVNLDAVFMGTREAIRAMKSSGGSIINVSSMEGLVGYSTLAAYNSSKGGVRLFTKSAALHCAEQGYNIRVNSLHPGSVDTAMVSGAMATLSEEEASAFMQQTLANIPVGRMGEPDDIANGILYLASDEAGYVTGSELVIDGGYTAR